jgi:N-acetyl-anhydromuramyl-L-alanine amidase AmpD
MTPKDLAAKMRAWADEIDPPVAEVAPAPAVPTVAAQPLSINRTRFRLPESQYIPEVTPKDLVVLHFTAGSSAEGAYSHWMSDEQRVATAYIIDRDGAVYELFDPKHWAFHLGIPGQASQSYKHDRRSIGIEFVNVGPLRRKGDELFWWPPGNFSTKYCTVDELAKYKEEAHRGERYYATFTPQQYESGRALVSQLCESFSIPRVIPGEGFRLSADINNPATSYFQSFQGIASHQNFRSDKFDIGPAFDWAKIMHPDK